MNATSKDMATVKDLMGLKASDVMTTPVTKVHVWDSIHDVGRIFAEKNIGSAAVVDMNDLPLGVITKSDLVRYSREQLAVMGERDAKTPRAARTSEKVDQRGFHLEPEEATIEHWMTPALFDVHPSTPLPAVVKKMVKNGLHHIFVTDTGEKKKVKGVITAFDILMVMNRLLNQES